MARGTLLAIVAAAIIIGGFVWYIGRGGVDNDRPIEGRLETETQPWAVPEEDVPQDPELPVDQPETPLPAN